MVDAYGDASMAAAAKPRRFPWRGVMVVLLVVAAALVAVAVFLPHLLPSSVVRRQVAAMLADALGRRVTVGWARLRWDEGLTAGDVRIASRTGDGLLARAEQLTVAFRPSEAARAVAGADVPLESLRIDGLELWLVVDEAGRWNVADLAEGDPPEVGTIQIGGARVHVDNRQTGRELEFKQVNASVGELASTGNAYVNLSADLCPAPDAGAAAAAPADASADAAPSCGRVVLTANLDRLRLEPGEAPVGSVKAEWSDLPWPRLMAALVPASPLAGLLARTSGRMSAQLGPARAWSAEGAIQGARLALPATADRPAAAALPQAILGFRMHRASARAPLVVDLLNFSTPGLDVKATGTVEMASAGPATAAASGETERAAALKPGEAADAAEPPAWAVRTIDLTASGDVSWVPLCQNAAPLRPLLERFDRVGGKARFDLRVRSSEEGVRLEGSADLSDTIVVAEGRIAKTRHDRLRVDVKADGDRGLERVSPVTVHVVSDALTAHVEAAVPVRDVLRLGQADAAAEGVGPGSAARLSATEATAAVTVREASALLALVPALGARLGPVEVHGPCRVDVALRPMDAAAPGAGKGSAGKADLLSATWTTALRADLTDAAVAMPGGPNKPAGTAARLDVDAILWPTSRRSDVRTLALRLGEGRVAWDGEARVDWPRRPQEQPVGRFEGTLAIEKMAALGAVLARDRFDPTPPVAGGAVFDVVADLAEGRLRTHMQAGLAPLDLHLGDYLVKPAGQSASLALTTLWHPGRWNHVEGKADLDLPGVRLSALGQATIVAHLEQRTPPPPPAGTDDAKAAEASTVPEGPGPAAAAADGPKNTVTLTLVPKSTIEVRASVSDLARAAAISPLLETALADHQAEGGAEARAVVAFRKRGPQVTADVDLTQTALDLGRLLKKPAGAGLTARLVGDLAPNPQGWVDVNVDEAEARLADSVLRTQGRVRINLAGLAATVKPEARLAAAVAEADLTVRADWQHGPALRRALPWLAPVARRCLLDGPPGAGRHRLRRPRDRRHGRVGRGGGRAGHRQAGRHGRLGPSGGPLRRGARRDGRRGPGGDGGGGDGACVGAAHVRRPAAAGARGADRMGAPGGRPGARRGAVGVADAGPRGGPRAGRRRDGAPAGGRRRERPRGGIVPPRVRRRPGPVARPDGPPRRPGGVRLRAAGDRGPAPARGRVGRAARDVHFPAER